MYYCILCKLCATSLLCCIRLSLRTAQYTGESKVPSSIAAAPAYWPQRNNICIQSAVHVCFSGRSHFVSILFVMLAITLLVYFLATDADRSVHSQDSVIFSFRAGFFGIKHTLSRIYDTLFFHFFIK
jgi:hypothetical protein